MHGPYTGTLLSPSGGSMSTWSNLEVEVCAAALLKISVNRLLVLVVLFALLLPVLESFPIPYCYDYYYCYGCYYHSCYYYH